MIGESAGARSNITMISLQDQQPITRGGTSVLYRHPHEPSLIIKVMRKRGRPRAWYETRRRFGPYLPALREIREICMLHAHAPHELALVERVIGFAETDLGLGLVVEALQDRKGDVAPNLRTLRRRNAVNGEVAAKLEAFLQQLENSSFVISDLKAQNIVYAFDPATGEERFVLVDGIGPKTLISLSLISRAINRLNSRRHVRRFRNPRPGRKRTRARR